MRIFKWLLVPASVLAAISFAVFIVADIQRMRSVRFIATSIFVLSCVMTLAAVLIAWRERRRRAGDAEAEALRSIRRPPPSPDP